MLVFLMVFLLLFEFCSSKIIENNIESYSSALKETTIKPVESDANRELSSETWETVLETPVNQEDLIPFKAILKNHKQKFKKKDPGNLSPTVVRACNSNAQCQKDECCLQKPWTNHFFCAKRIREGKVCWSRPHNATDTWDKYRIICPCISKHECRFQDPIFVLKPVLAASTCQPKKEEKT
ncbi:hypothetical protein JTE90_015363 [Oedothorax gibbosus]|uniref:Uncharacterized protein n=1 Tax=Oedothorax gibbosus TaxID=931172 RepID=A0AAV6U3Z3_9ARAC|nr:hypothetical protein JTE90_015363 [Oedothorax gibbosus]